MEASLDTNVIIHLYEADCQSLLFNRFRTCYVHEFIRNQELNRHANKKILSNFDGDLASGKIKIYGDAELRMIGMQPVFLQHIKDQKILYEGSDLGEVYAISLARTLGCMCLVTDDIKERGPHYTLMRTPDSDVIPFAFYEILFLDYLQERMSANDCITTFGSICASAGLLFEAKSKLSFFIKRFWKDPYTNSEKIWMENFCLANEISYKEKLQELQLFITQSN